MYVTLDSFMGGAFEVTLAAGFIIPIGTTRWASIEMTNPAQVVLLPLISDPRIRLGWPFLFVHNKGTISFLLQDQDGLGISSVVPSGAVRDMCVVTDANGNRTWLGQGRFILEP